MGTTERPTSELGTLVATTDTALAVTASERGSIVANPTAAGEVICDCGIDLPKNDVIESIDFERFFMLNLSYGDLRGPATLPLGRDVSAFNSVPLSADGEDWGALRARVFETRIPTSHYAERLDEAATTPTFTQPTETARSSSALESNALESRQSVSVAPMPLALYLPFRQQWKLRGYNRGRLVSSFTLAPQEEQTIEVFKWDRLTRTMESSTTFESEDTSESSSTRRDTTDVARDVSRQTGFETNSSGKVGFKVGVVNADLSAGFNAKAGVNDAEKETRNAITEATSRSASRVRTSRTLKVVESREQGQESRTTRKLRNPNNCHTLTVAFSEILANYEVDTFVRADASRLVVLVDSQTLAAIDHFTAATIRQHETPLRLALMDRALADGFDAARFLEARARACAVLCSSCGCDAATATEDSTQLSNLRAATATLATVLGSIAGYQVQFPLSILGVPTPATAPSDDVKRYAFRKALQSYAPGLLGELTTLGLSTTAASITVSQIESINRILSGVADENYPKLIADVATTDAVRGEIYVYLLTFVIPEPISAAVTLGIIWARLNGLPTFDDFGFVSAVNGFRGAYSAWQAWRAEQIAKDEKLAAIRRIEKQERDLRVLEAFPLRETAYAGERLQALLAHVNDPRNRDHYRFAIWNERSGATDSTLMSLALAGILDPNPVGMVGDQLAVPVKLVPGTKLHQFFHETMADLLVSPPQDHDDYILPTSALYAEAMLGSCTSCEELIERNGELDLERKRIENTILHLESQRLTARLDAEPPQLDRNGSVHPAIRVELVSAPAADSPDA